MQQHATLPALQASPIGFQGVGFVGHERLEGEEYA